MRNIAVMQQVEGSEIEVKSEKLIETLKQVELLLDRPEKNKELILILIRNAILKYEKND